MTLISLYPRAYYSNNQCLNKCTHTPIVQGRNYEEINGVSRYCALCSTDVYLFVLLPEGIGFDAQLISELCPTFPDLHLLLALS